MNEIEQNNKLHQKWDNKEKEWSHREEEYHNKIATLERLCAQRRNS